MAGLVSSSMHMGGGYEKSMIMRATPMTRPIIRLQKAPASFILGQEMAKQNIMAIGGDK